MFVSLHLVNVAPEASEHTVLPLTQTHEPWPLPKTGVPFWPVHGVSTFASMAALSAAVDPFAGVATALVTARREKMARTTFLVYMVRDRMGVKVDCRGLE